MYEGKQTGRNRCMFIDEQNVINRVSAPFNIH
ncbi:diguanylate cyclase, partial [Escherichia coli]|nr:diguanylate cyclase [Escherichia coli]